MLESGSVRSCVSDEWLCREEEGFLSTGYLIELVLAGFFILTNPSSCDGYREAPTNLTSEVNGTYC